ncbi:response regulator [Gloeobacter kilaueensis]|uniref:Two component, sigma54 specific, transcriptional regulator, Fis family n=1 Tax=Gloeobacter kilaueensis (strain ATCC BAA-2537 / CCAP 1431/1 / ULC 316 / JS1) TaxID=1183438 RepID=U5QJT4_GLOK1|nr:response regulator [Gloeobacter kilaueensis]AGY59252.1 two component, sigma54 specific, transcriptional regulator, Fis family [Gloeobacter kilaueensis JS1]
MAHFLLVDDETTIRQHYRTLLEPRGHTCVEAGSYSEALGYIEASECGDQSAFDLIILDHDINPKYGSDLVRDAREILGSNCCKYNFIVSTGFPDTNLAVMYNRLGALGHFIKPIDRHIAMFWTTLESALNDERRSIHTGIEQLKKLTATRQDEVVKTNIGIHTAARDKYGLLQTCADWLELLANGEQYERLDSAVTDLRSLLRQRSISLHDYFYLLSRRRLKYSI